MDERLHICLWMVGGGAFAGLLGGIFGAVVAALYERNGGVAGTRLARNLVENFLKSGERLPSPTLRAALIGGVDGFFFLGGLGLIAGTLLGRSGRTADELLPALMFGSVFLIGGAIYFGSMAYALRYHATQFFYIIASTCLCVYLIYTLFGSDYVLYGIGAGPILGISLFAVNRSK